MAARFSHRKHGGDGSACASCHLLTTTRRELRPPRGHAACTGSGCHVRAGAPAPALTNCAACHELGALARRERERAATPWSVRATFRHAPHRSTTAGAPLPCAACHRDLASASDLMAVPTPAKATCAPCHDGRVAFKLTGHGCARCHQPGADPTP
jgi:c(7)-type cytochrome triheme protein